MMLKQTAKAKQVLKRIGLQGTHVWTIDDAANLEQCWLLLADIYIKQGKSAQAADTLALVMSHNAVRSSAINIYP